MFSQFNSAGHFVNKIPWSCLVAQIKEMGQVVASCASRPHAVRKSVHPSIVPFMSLGRAGMRYSASCLYLIVLTFMFIYYNSLIQYLYACSPPSSLPFFSLETCCMNANFHFFEMNMQATSAAYIPVSLCSPLFMVLALRRRGIY